MRTLTGLALSPLLALTFATPPAAAASATPAYLPPPRCAPQDVAVDAAQVAPVARSVVLVHVVNTRDHGCTVDRFPTVTFGGLDGSARPEPPAESYPHTLAPGQSVFAAVGTDDHSGHTRYAPTLTVAADPTHTGTTFTAPEIGAPTPGIPVYDPITTWWHPTPDDALAALPR